MARLTIEVTDEQHQHIKALAALQGKTIKDYALERLLEPTADEAQALEELKALLVPRIEAGLAGNVSTKTLDEIVESELQANRAT
jgi:hypothetical protein